MLVVMFLDISTLYLWACTRYTPVKPSEVWSVQDEMSEHDKLALYRSCFHPLTHNLFLKQKKPYLNMLKAQH